MRYLGLAMLALTGMGAGAAAAQDAAQTPSATATSGNSRDDARVPIADAGGSGARRIRSVTLAPGERCPPSTGDEVVVCYNGGNPFRIPPALRETAPSAANESWINRAATIDQTSRVAGGLPDTCSAVGTGGQSGCAQAYARAYAAEKRAREAQERVTPGGDEE